MLEVVFSNKKPLTKMVKVIVMSEGKSIKTDLLSEDEACLVKKAIIQADFSGEEGKFVDVFGGRAKILLAGIGKQKDELSESLVGVIRKTFPLFILGFLIAIGFNTIGLFSIELPFLNRPLSDFIGVIAKFLFASALAGVGFKIKFSEVFSKGSKPILLGGVTWFSVSLSSLLFVFLFLT